MTPATFAAAKAAHDAGINPAEILEQLNEAAIGLDAAADRLASLMREYEGGPGADGVYRPGPQLRWLELVGDHQDTILEECGEHRPLKAVLERRAVKRARLADPDLYADYHRLRSEIAVLQKWISAKRETISARQSILRAEGVLAGSPPQYPGRAA